MLALRHLDRPTLASKNHAAAFCPSGHPSGEVMWAWQRGLVQPPSPAPVPTTLRPCAPRPLPMRRRGAAVTMRVRSRCGTTDNHSASANQSLRWSTTTRLRSPTPYPNAWCACQRETSARLSATAGCNVFRYAVGGYENEREAGKLFLFFLLIACLFCWFAGLFRVARWRVEIGRRSWTHGSSPGQWANLPSSGRAA